MDFSAVLRLEVAAQLLQQHLNTSWTLVDAANASAEQIAAATAFIEAPASMLKEATSGELYQFTFTGIPEADASDVQHSPPILPSSG